MENSISQKVIERIRRGEIEPRSKWYFWLSHAGVFLALAMFLAAGAVCMGIILDLLYRFEISRLIRWPGGLNIILSSLPYLWMALLAAVAILAIWEYGRTRHGYRTRRVYVIVATLAIVVVSGEMLCIFGYCYRLDNGLRGYSAYDQLTPAPERVWLQPERGLLSGMIITDDQEAKSLELMDWEDDIWSVDYNNAQMKAENENGDFIKILGRPKNETKQFMADEIRPWPNASQKMIEKGNKKKNDKTDNQKSNSGRKNNESSKKAAKNNENRN